MTKDGGEARANLFVRAGEALATLAGISLLFMVVVIAVGVVMRFIFATPILGSNELVQLAAVAVVMLALPYCTASDGHVRVDVFDAAIGWWGRLIGDVASRLLAASVLGVLSWRASLKALDAQRYGDATNMLALPIWPFFGLLAFGAALAALVLVAQLISLFPRKAHK